MQKQYNVIDLFCGCGGLSYGFEQAGFQVLLGIDNDKAALETFIHNHKNAKGFLGDITQLSYGHIQKLIGDKKIDVIIGGPPCQGMSLSGFRIYDDPRNTLYLSYIRLVKEIMPSAFVIENVPGLVSLFGGKIKDSIIKEFTDMGYQVTYQTICAADYGVPQNRKRVFFVGFLQDTVFEYPQKDSLTVTCKMALSDLPSLEEELGEEGMDYLSLPQNPYQKLMRKNSAKVYNHIAAVHSQKVQSIIALVPDGCNYKSLPPQLKNTRNFNIAWTRFCSYKPAPTIDTGHRHHFHYEYNRVPTVRECARLQSFPDDFRFFGNKTQQFRQVGNAVPPLMAKAVAEKLKTYLLCEGKEMYQVPQEYYYRIHHVRPRFKGNIENVLSYMATEIARLPQQPRSEFADNMNDAIRHFPGNARRKLKTIQNWRTEISSLFGFIESDKTTTWPGLRAVELAEHGDLVESFKLFLYNFQYPGAHIKSHEVLRMVEQGIRFKPAQYLLALMKTAEEQEGCRIGFTKAEITYCVFNDLRCTRDGEDVASVWARIKANRENGVVYDQDSDVIRYAGDILDYMEIANLLVCHDGRNYFVNHLENVAVLRFIHSAEWFSGYDSFIQNRTATLAQINDCKQAWFCYVNRPIEKTDFETDVFAFISNNQEEYEGLKKKSLDFFSQRLENPQELNTKDIGDIGESLIHSHECQRIKLGGRQDIMERIKQIPNHFAAGYDIQSMELDERKRYIEVKTTISSKPLIFHTVHLTANEWKTAETLKEAYFIYRLMISKHETKLFIIQNPVGLYKQDKLQMRMQGDGADITFDTTNAGVFEELLSWEN